MTELTIYCLSNLVTPTVIAACEEYYDMSDAPERARHPSDDLSEDPFGDDDVLPFEKQRRVHEYLSQETRHHIVQSILGHPEHLLSLDEFAYLVPKNRSSINDQLQDMRRKGITEKYVHEPNRSTRGIPAEFWGLTEYGVTLLYEYKYLRGVPVLRALQDHVHLNEQMQRHRSAARPPLPEAVDEALAFPEADETDFEEFDVNLEELASQQLFDAPPAEPPPGSDEDDRPIDELFE